MNQAEQIDQLLRERSGIRLDIGCGAYKQSGFVGMDARPLDGVDIVHNVLRFPWPLPDECVVQAFASHLLEHLSPDYGDTRIEPLVRLLMAKGLLTLDEVRESIGEFEDTMPRFMRFMDEVWRVLKPRARFAITIPHGRSDGFVQDPTHVNMISEATMGYFDPYDPLGRGVLWTIYQPKPWRLVMLTGSPYENLEIILEKRPLSDLDERPAGEVSTYE